MTKQILSDIRGCQMHHITQHFCAFIIRFSRDLLIASFYGLIVWVMVSNIRCLGCCRRWTAEYIAPYSYFAEANNLHGGGAARTLISAGWGDILRCLRLPTRPWTWIFFIIRIFADLFAVCLLSSCPVFYILLYIFRLLFIFFSYSTLMFLWYVSHRGNTFVWNT